MWSNEEKAAIVLEMIRGEEALAFVNRHLISVMNSQTVSVPDDEGTKIRINPKRTARALAREAKTTPVSTKAQETLQLQLEENKMEKRALTTEQKRKEQEEKRLPTREKAKKKHRGR